MKFFIGFICGAISVAAIIAGVMSYVSFKAKNLKVDTDDWGDK